MTRYIITILLVVIPSIASAEYAVLLDSSGNIVLAQSCEGDCYAAVGAMEANRAGMGAEWAKAKIEVLLDDKYQKKLADQEEALRTK